MTEQELQAMLQSDMRLWESAERTDATGDAITLVLDLPYDIGITEVTLQGVSDAGKRRDAVAAFGAHIRGVVDAKIGEAAELEREAKAIQKAAMAAPVKEEDVAGSARLEEVVAALTPKTVADRLVIVCTELDRLKDAHIELTLELRGLQAYMEAYDAPTHKKTPDGSPASEGKEEVSGTTRKDD